MIVISQIKGCGGTELIAPRSFKYALNEKPKRNRMQVPIISEIGKFYSSVKWQWILKHIWKCRLHGFITVCCSEWLQRAVHGEVQRLLPARPAHGPALHPRPSLHSVRPRRYPLSGKYYLTPVSPPVQDTNVMFMVLDQERSTAATLSPPFAKGQAFVVSVLDSVLSLVYCRV